MALDLLAGPRRDDTSRRNVARPVARPLALTPWERYMALDHGPRHSMTCFSRFWLSQPVDREAFSEAVGVVARDNPLLAACRRGRAWLPIAFDPEQQIDWNEAGAAVELRHQRPDDMLVRWTVRVGRLGDLGLDHEGPADTWGTLVILRYPHAVADGLAAAAVIRQVCGVLAGDPRRAPTHRDLDARVTLGRTPRAGRGKLRHELVRIAHYFIRLPAEFAPDPVDAADAPAIACERVVASTAATEALRAAARAARVTVNDALVAALFRTLGPLMHPRDRIRIAVPTSLRGEANEAFCNQVSMVFLDRVAAETADERLLRGISTEMAHVKRWKLGHAMHLGLNVAVRIGDRLLRRMMPLPVFTSTAVLSNLGDTFPRVGDAADGIRVVGHDLLPPLRPGTNLAVAAASHDGRLALTARFAADHISRERARGLLERLLSEAAAAVAGT